MSNYPKLKLKYFDLNGRAECVRLAFHVGGIPFVDERFTFEQFPELKKEYPYGQAPVLEVDGVLLAQSQALLRYAGRLGKLYPPNDALAALKIDEILCGINDLTNALIPSLREKDEEKKKIMRKQLAEVDIPRYMTIFESRLKKMKEYPVFQTEQLFIHHFLIFTMTEWFKSGRIDHVPVTITDSYPLWTEITNKVASHPKVKEWQNSVKSNLKPKLKLTYFQAAGRAEAIRLALFIGGVEFEDERITKEQFAERKSSAPFNQLPILEINGEVLAQSMAILRYAGTLSGLYPVEDAVLGLRNDEFCDAVDEYISAFVPAFMEQDEEKKKSLFEELVTVRTPRTLEFLDKRIALWNSPYAVCERLTIADLVIYGIVGMLESGRLEGMPKDVTSPYTNLKRIADQVSKHPKVQEWNASHQN